MAAELSNVDKESLLYHFDKEGFYVARHIFSHSELNDLRQRSEECIEYEASLYSELGMQCPYGRIFTCVAYGEKFLNIFLNNLFYDQLMTPFDEVNPILHVFTTSSIPPGNVNVFNRPHVDSNYPYGNFLEGIGCVVMLTDFTSDNGATWVIPGSHKKIMEPGDLEFEERGIQVTGNAGDVIIFHPRLWHKSANNFSDEWRHSLSIGVSRPWVRPHVDHFRLVERMGAIPENPRLLQLLGAYSTPFKSEKDYYLRA